MNVIAANQVFLLSYSVTLHNSSYELKNKIADDKICVMSPSLLIVVDRSSLGVRINRSVYTVKINNILELFFTQNPYWKGSRRV